MNQSLRDTFTRGGKDSLPTMLILTGDCRSHAAPPMIGKLLFPDETPCVSGAYLTVVSHEDSLSRLEDTGTVGGIWIGERPLNAEELSALPCPVLSLPSLPPSCRGKIALLDPECATLFVCPDLKTVNRYTERLSSPPIDQDSALFLPNGKRIRVGHILRSCVCAEESDGYAVDPALLSPFKGGSEEEIHELLRDLAEQATGLSLTVFVDAPAVSASEENFHDCIRGVFRSAVYGSFSLALRGTTSEEQIRCCLDRIHRIFCELESEGREFNGYIPKGILLRSPFLLTEALSFDGIDFVCLDSERLLFLMSDGAPAAKETQIQLGEHLSAFCRRTPRLRKSVLLGDLPLCPELCRMLLDCGITEWYPSTERIAPTRSVLATLLSENGIPYKKSEKNNFFPKKT